MLKQKVHSQRLTKREIIRHSTKKILDTNLLSTKDRGMHGLIIKNSVVVLNKSWFMLILLLLKFWNSNNQNSKIDILYHNNYSKTDERRSKSGLRVLRKFE